MIKRRKKRQRTGAMLSMEMVVVLPMVVGIGLAIVQFITIATSKYRVEVAGANAAQKAAAGWNINKVHETAGLVLSPHLTGAYQTQMEYYDKAEDPKFASSDKDEKGTAGVAEPEHDYVIVSVRIPTEFAARNWLGFLGGSVKNLHLRSVVKLPVTKKFEIPVD